MKIKHLSQAASENCIFILMEETSKILFSKYNSQPNIRSNSLKLTCEFIINVNLFLSILQASAYKKYEHMIIAHLQIALYNYLVV